MVHPTAAVTPGFSKPPSRRRRRGQRPTAKKWFFFSLPFAGYSKVGLSQPMGPKKVFSPPTFGSDDGEESTDAGLARRRDVRKEKPLTRKRFSAFIADLHNF
ncbi:uncharacterized protein [Gossypium hirsutum]|uniref:Uncharacterized protein isoform X2 n=1 Tax=Gossypium hirsutum TaxID=3635 RepID=A0ABM2ZT11_GOSHI|nr:uncharacterized protein LOC121215384 isoform X2 [Gossypium hirsutum]